MNASRKNLGRMLAAATLLMLAACSSAALQGAIDDGGAASGDDGARPEAGRVDGKPDDPDASVNGAEDAATVTVDAGLDAAKDSFVAVDCAAPPVTPLFTSLQGPFCPFQAGNTFSNCALGEHCCEYTEDVSIPSTCSAGPTACAAAIATGFDWRCDEQNDCPGGQVCCFGGLITPKPQCAGQFAASATTHFSGCRIATCAAGEMRMCGSSAECPAGSLCRTMRVRGKHIGFCAP